MCHLRGSAMYRAATFICLLLLAFLVVPISARGAGDPDQGRAAAARKLTAMTAKPAKGVHVKCGDPATPADVVILSVELPDVTGKVRPKCKPKELAEAGYVPPPIPADAPVPLGVPMSPDDDPSGGGAFRAQQVYGPRMGGVRYDNYANEPRNHGGLANVETNTIYDPRGADQFNITNWGPQQYNVNLRPEGWSCLTSVTMHKRQSGVTRHYAGFWRCSGNWAYLSEMTSGWRSRFERPDPRSGFLPSYYTSVSIADSGGSGCKRGTLFDWSVNNWVWVTASDCTYFSGGPFGEWVMYADSTGNGYPHYGYWTRLTDGYQLNPFTIQWTDLNGGWAVREDPPWGGWPHVFDYDTSPPWLNAVWGV